MPLAISSAEWPPRSGIAVQTPGACTAGRASGSVQRLGAAALWLAAVLWLSAVPALGAFRALARRWPGAGAA